MWVLGHLAALIGIKEDVVDVERSSNKGLLVGLRNLDGSRCLVKVIDSPQALSDGAKIKVDLDLVVLEGNQWKSKSRVLAEPELKRNVKGGLRKGVARSAHLGRSSR